MSRTYLLPVETGVIQDFVVSSLQSRSYHSLIIGLRFCFRSIGEICSLIKNSFNLQEARISCSNTEITEECNLDRSLHFPRSSHGVHRRLSGLFPFCWDRYEFCFIVQTMPVFM